MSKPKKPTFEECYDRIIAVINGLRWKWQLTSIAWVSFEDVSSVVANHISKKWFLYDPKQNLEGWVAAVTKNQFQNLARGFYSSFAKPCRACCMNEGEGENHCRLFGTQDEARCPILKKWAVSKKNKYNIELPLAMEYHSNEVSNKPHSEIDYTLALSQLKEKLQPLLTKYEYKIYLLLFVEHKSREEAAKEMGYRSKEKDKHAGYRRIVMVEKLIYDKAKKLIYDGEIDF